MLDERVLAAPSAAGFGRALVVTPVASGAGGGTAESRRVLTTLPETGHLPVFGQWQSAESGLKPAAASVRAALRYDAGRSVHVVWETPG